MLTNKYSNKHYNEVKSYKLTNEQKQLKQYIVACP